MSNVPLLRAPSAAAFGGLLKSKRGNIFALLFDVEMRLGFPTDRRVDHEQTPEADPRDGNTIARSVLARDDRNGPRALQSGNRERLRCFVDHRFDPTEHCRNASKMSERRIKG